jgi:hypothetical protein
MANDHQEQDERTIVSQSSLSDYVVQASSLCTKMVTENCGLCTVYCDKQIQYESVAEQYILAGGSSLGNLFHKLDDNTDAQVYRNVLFDEDSVVESVSSRHS